jgi:tetratricopeptide (TPR) repeat protein
VARREDEDAERVVDGARVVKAGDLLVFDADGGGVRPARLLALDAEPPIAHLLLFERREAVPRPEEFPGLPVWAWHVPLAADAVLRDARVVGHAPVRPEELQGFAEYLKRTDFSRYLAVTGQDRDRVFADVAAAFADGYARSEAGDVPGAIEAYSRTLELFPGYADAVDNRGLLHMERGEWDRAIADFERSLEIAPDNPLALLSLAECHLGKRDPGRARPILAACVRRWPDEPRFREALGRAMPPPR